MELQIHCDPSVFEALKDEWNALLARGVCRVPFLRAEYQGAWWAHRGGGEWPEAELAVVTAREAGALVGVAPLFAARNRDGRRALLLVGSIEISDYLDLIVERRQADRFCRALLERLTAPDAPAWDVLDWYNLPAVSPTRAALARAAAARGWAATEQVLEPVPAIALPGDWETYLATMVEKKERQEIRRKLRRAEASEDRVSWHIVDGARYTPEAGEAFLDLMALSEDKARFLTPVMRDQFRATLRAAAEAGWLHLAFLTVGGVNAAAYLSFDDGRRLYVYNSAIDPRFGALSVGWVLLGYLLQWAIENRRAEFDFMRGGEDYKFRFGAVANAIYRAQVSPRLSAAELGGEPLREFNAQEAEYFPGGG